MVVDLGRLAGRAQHRLGDYAAADESFTRAGRVDSDRRNWDGLARTALAATPRGAGGFFTGYGVVVSGSSALRTQALVHRADLAANVSAELAVAEAAARAVHGLPGAPDLLADAWARSAPGAESWWQVRLAEFVRAWEPTTIDDRARIADELTELAGSDPDARATALHLRRVCALEAGDMRLVRRLSAEFTRVAAEGGADLATMQLWWDVMLAVLRGDYERSHALMADFTARSGEADQASRLLVEASLLTSSSIEMWHRGRLGEALGEADRLAEDFDPDFALVVAMAAAELGDHDRALRTVESLIALPGRLTGPKVAVRVPLLVEALLAVGLSAPRAPARCLAPDRGDRALRRGLERPTRGAVARPGLPRPSGPVPAHRARHPRVARCATLRGPGGASAGAVAIRITVIRTLSWACYACECGHTAGVAERRGTGLQSRQHGFESRHPL